jgi:hypothetical protein
MPIRHLTVTMNVLRDVLEFTDLLPSISNSAFAQGACADHNSQGYWKLIAECKKF